MGDIIIKAENLGKSYIIGHQKQERYTALRDVLVNKAKSFGGKTKQIFKSGHLIPGNETEEFWALKDINLEIKQGDRIGIIGRNGAGKSTLLKVLSRITEPTTGRITMRGRVASLLEVGTGFHPELTGRENIFLNGAILGMSRAEIKKKFDEIVDFSGVEKFLDTPVKRYSSGMYVRLAFSVAAHLEPDILVVDEVLAVGDAEFQKKAIGKMQNVSRGEGRTVLFVSHNMGSIKTLCKSGIVLSKGKIIFNGSVDSAIENYLSQQNTKDNTGIADFRKENIGDDQLKLIEVSVFNKNNTVKTIFSPSEEIFIKIKFFIIKEISGMRFNLTLKTISGEIAFVTSSHNLTKSKIKDGEYVLQTKIPANLLNTTRYTLTLNAGIPGYKPIFGFIDCINIDIDGVSLHGSTFPEKWPGVVSPKIDWKYE